MSTGTQDLGWQIQSPAAAATSGTLDLGWRVFDSTAATTGVLALSWSLAQNTITLELDGAPSGLVGTLSVRLVTLEDVVVYGQTTSGIVETPAGTGRYVATIPEPDAGSYYVIWTDGATTISALVVVSIGGFVITMTDRLPPAREDGIPWFEVTLQESVTRTGEWRDLDTFVLSPVDDDPANPLARGFTTNNATVTDAFYRLVWSDVDAGVYEGNPE